MGLCFLLVFSLLLTTAAPASDFNKIPCASIFQENLHRHPHSGGIDLPLHHIHGPCSPVKTKTSSFVDVVQHDQSRIQTLNSRLFKTTTNPLPESVNLPLNSGNSVGTGNYIITIGLGTPARNFITVVDTGSTFSWVQCRPCIDCHSQKGPIFDPTASQTYATVHCSSAECSEIESATLNPTGCSRSKTCLYQSSYGDGSFSVGALSKDTLTIAPGQNVRGFIYGCGQDNQGLFGQSAGLVGLSRHKLSLLSQISSKYGYVFSYCLPTPSSTGTLSFGAYSPSLYSFTPMRSDSRDPSLYFLRLARITVLGRAITVPASEYTDTPTLIDSGTVITRLPWSVYTAFKGAFVKGMAAYARAPAFSILDTCFKGSVKRMSVPEVRLVYEGGAMMKLAAGNVLYEVRSGISCLAFAANSEIAIIGNHLQQGFRVLYDVSNLRIGFAPSGCG